LLAGVPAERQYARVLLGIVTLFVAMCAVQRLWQPVGRVHAQNIEPNSTRGALQPLAHVVADGTSVDSDGQAEPCVVCQMPPTVQPDAPPWRSWASLTGRRLVASSDAATMPVFAARVPDGVAILVANHDSRKVAFRLAVRLARGVYTVERFGFDPKTPETLPHVERLESVVRGSTGTVAKPAWLLPEMAAIYRFTDRSAQTQNAFRSVKSCVRSFMTSRPSAFRRVMAPLRECESNIGALSAGIQPDQRYDCLRYVHRALLTVAHAQALSRNARGEGLLTGRQAGTLASALDHLEEILTELSAACLDLVPGVSVETPDPEHLENRVVTIVLTNAGRQTVSFVKIGASVPAGCSVRPAEEAFFADLKPGETARATFTIRCGDGDDSVGADIAWFAASVPAHLRLKTPGRPAA